MSWYKFSKAINFEEMFGFPRESLPKIKSRSESKKEKYTITLYRGFDADLNNLEKIGDSYILSPEKCEQGVLWFTHSLMSDPDPLEYVKGRGKYILTFPIEVERHYKEIIWENGKVSRTIPEEIIELANPYENSKYHMGIELPDGFFFSYKTQKFIISEIPIVVRKEMIIKDETSEELV